MGSCATLLPETCGSFLERENYVLERSNLLCLPFMDITLLGDDGVIHGDRLQRGLVLVFPLIVIRTLLLLPRDEALLLGCNLFAGGISRVLLYGALFQATKIGQTRDVKQATSLADDNAPPMRGGSAGV